MPRDRKALYSCYLPFKQWCALPVLTQTSLVLSCLIMCQKSCILCSIDPTFLSPPLALSSADWEKPSVISPQCRKSKTRLKGIADDCLIQVKFEFECTVYYSITYIDIALTSDTGAVIPLTMCWKLDSMYTYVDRSYYWQAWAEQSVLGKAAGRLDLIMANKTHLCSSSAEAQWLI